MSSITKRQQARNERALQDLTRNVSGNDRCADCATKNPTWASWNLGIFVCMRCAALHRKLGTHISKVKSLSMDSWSTEQVENMRATGNVVSNHKLNPANTLPNIPIDADEADAAVERFIRMKYEQGAFAAGAKTQKHHTGSTATGNDEPPPLPPKPSKRLGFTLRSSSANTPKGKITSGYTVEDSRKPGQLFGMKITSIGNNFEQKLVMLGEMGFMDKKQNSDVLKAADGDLNRAIETLTRIGNISESPRTQSPVQSAGLTVDKTRSNNPWEMKAPQRSATAPLPQPLRSQSTEQLSSRNPFLQPNIQTSFSGLSLTAQNSPTVSFTASPLQQQYTGTNPFLQSASPQVMSPTNPWATAQAATPGTPHHNPFGLPESNSPQVVQDGFAPSAVYPTSSSFFPPQAGGGQTVAQASHARFDGSTVSGAQSAFTPNMSHYTQQSGASRTQQGPQPNGAFAQPGFFAQQSPAFAQQGLQQTDTFLQHHSPFAQQTSSFPQQSPPQQSPPAQQSLSFPQQHPLSQQNPSFASSTSTFNPYMTSTQQQHSQPSLAQMGQSVQSLPSQSPSVQVQNAHQAQSASPYQQFGMAQHASVGATQPQAMNNSYVQQPIRHDKSTIMALYSQPSFSQSRSMQTLPEDAPFSLAPQVASRAVPQQQQYSSIAGHASKESVDFQGFSKDGRHSPDAFAGLSSQYMR